MAQEQRRPVRYHRREPAPEQPAPPAAPTRTEHRAPEPKAAKVEESPDGD